MKRFLILFLLFPILVEAQPPGSFLTKWGGSGDDVGYSAKQTLDGQYIIAGSSSSYGTHGSTDVYLTKLDTMGFVIWQKFYGGVGNEVGKSVIQLSDSSYVITGFTSSYGVAGYDALLMRVDKNGNQLWQTTFGGDDWDFANDVVLAADGNLFVVGNTSSFGNKQDGFVLKYDTSGNQLLYKLVSGAENEDLRSIIVTNDNYLATVGYTESKGDINGDCYFLKMDLNADTLFSTTFGGPYKDFGSDLVQKSSSYGDVYYIGGARTYSAGAKSHAYMYQMSPTGAYVSDEDQFRNADDEEFISVANSKLSPDLTAFVRSTTLPGKSMQEEIWVVLLDGSYTVINDAGYAGHEYVYSVEATRDKGYISVGSTDGYGSLGKDIFFVKRDSNVINYPTITGLSDLAPEKQPVVFFSDEMIRLQPAAPEIKQVQIIDITGRIIAKFTTTDLQSTIDISKYAASVYILKIEYVNGTVHCEKFIH